MQSIFGGLFILLCIGLFARKYSTTTRLLLFGAVACILLLLYLA